MNEATSVIEAAKEYMTNTATFKSMRELGAILGISSHLVGKKLKEIGLRTADGKPSQRAIDGGLIKSVAFIEGFYFDVWHEEKTLSVLRPLMDNKK